MTPELQNRQRRLDTTYRAIVGAIAVIVSFAIIATFIQIYSINTKINNEVKQIQSAQNKNHVINNQQNSVILGYLVCIGSIQPQDRSPAVIQKCVTQAEKAEPSS